MAETPARVLNTQLADKKGFFPKKNPLTISQGCWENVRGTHLSITGNKYPWKSKVAILGISVLLCLLCVISRLQNA